MDFKVLLVDDDAVILFLHKILSERSKLPSPPYGFKSGKEALRFLANHTASEEAFLILLDLNMPVMNGWDFLERLETENYPEKICVAIVSSSIHSADAEKAKKYPRVIDYIEKPLHKEDCNRLYYKMQQLLQP